MSKLFFVFTILIFLGSFLDAEPVDPKPDESCTNEGEIYHYATSTRSPWEINELYAVPVGMINPASWDQGGSFQTQLLQILNSDHTPQAFAQACGEIWDSFFADNADVLVNVKRTVTRTDKPIQCTSGTWEIISTQEIEQMDVSDWLRVGSDPFDVSITESVSSLQQQLENLLNNLNSQPGAQSEQ